MDGTTFAITIKKNIAAGWGATTICVRCVSTATAPDTNFDFNSWRIEQYADCSTAMVLKNSALEFTVP